MPVAGAFGQSEPIIALCVPPFRARARLCAVTAPQCNRQFGCLGWCLLSCITHVQLIDPIVPLIRFPDTQGLPPFISSGLKTTWSCSTGVWKGTEKTHNRL